MVKTCSRTQRADAMTLGRSAGYHARMTMPVEKHRYSIREYLELEEKATERHEFNNGEILAMSGGTYRHCKINTNLIIALGNRLKGRRCEPLDSNMRVRIPQTARYVYPDTSIVCGQPEFDPDDPQQTTIVNPRAVIEVLSDSTESYDRGPKFELYRKIPALQEYVLISQREPLLETFLRQADGAWLFRPWKGIEAAAALRSLEITLELSDIYAGVDFEPAAGES